MCLSSDSGVLETPSRKPVCVLLVMNRKLQKTRAKASEVLHSLKVGKETCSMGQRGSVSQSKVGRDTHCRVRMCHCKTDNTVAKSLMAAIFSSAAPQDDVRSRPS